MFSDTAIKVQNKQSLDDIDEALSDEQLKFAHIALRSSQIKKDIFRDIRRGCYQTRWLLDKYSSDLFPEEVIYGFIEEIRGRVLTEHSDFDPAMELIGYLATNNELKQTMMSLLDSYRVPNPGGFDTYSLPPKTVAEVIKTIAGLDKDRLEFIKFAGLSIAMQGEEEEKLESSDKNILKVAFEQSEGTSALKIRNS